MLHVFLCVHGLAIADYRSNTTVAVWPHLAMVMRTGWYLVVLNSSVCIRHTKPVWPNRIREIDLCQTGNVISDFCCIHYIDSYNITYGCLLCD